MKKKILLSPLLIIVLIIIVGVGAAGAAILLGGGGSNTTDVNLSKGLVGWWKMDGDAKDSTPNANDGTVTGATLTTDRKGQTSKSYDFNGTTNYVDTADNDNFSPSVVDDMTISFWVKFDAVTAASVIIGKAELSNYEWAIRPNSVTLWTSAGADHATLTSYSSSATTGIWYHYTLVITDGNTTATILNFYRDGTLISATLTQTANSMSNTASKVTMGRRGDNQDYFDGLIDDVRIYNRALSAAEITALYQEYDPGIQVSNLQKGLVGYWDFGAGSTTAKTPDRTPYNNDGTVTGAVLANDRKGQAQKAYGFNGSTSKIDLGDVTILNGATTASWSFWFKLNSVTAERSVIARETSTDPTRQFSVTIGTSRQLTFNAAGGQRTYSGTNTMPLSAWTHVVVAYDGTQAAADRIKYYLNGASLSYTILNTVPTSLQTMTGVNLFIGHREANSLYFDGDLDDVRMYNRVLSATEIADLYNEYDPGIQVSTLQKGLLGQWKFNGDTKDVSPNGNNATTVAVASATGGTITYSGGYTIHTFTTSGTFTPSGSGTVEYLAVGGGGGGGTSGGRGGGGGAGGYRYNSSFAVTAQAYTVTVGNGGDAGVWTGSPGTSTDSKQGQDSVFSTITATGGGRGGGAGAGTGFSSNGGNGGSGGGGEANMVSTGGTGNTPSTSPSQGSDGGAGGTGGYGAGAGGGASAVGAAGSGSNGGAGGAGTSNSISGASVCYAGGGGGGSSGGTDGSATCGGGKGGTAQSAAVAGTANTGGGGGGAGASNAKAGGSGVVIIRYPSVGTFTTDRKGQTNKALVFNGQSDSSSASAVLNWTSTSAFSYGGWFKLNDTTTGYMLASNNGVGAGALITSLTKDIVSGKVTFVVGKQGTGQTNATSSTAYTTGSWEHYLAVYDGANNMTLYRNGVSVATGLYSNGSATSTGSGIYIMYASNNTNYVNGSIDDARAYNRALTATEALALYESY